MLFLEKNKNNEISPLSKVLKNIIYADTKAVARGHFGDHDRNGIVKKVRLERSVL